MGFLNKKINGLLQFGPQKSGKKWARGSSFTVL